MLPEAISLIKKLIPERIKFKIKSHLGVRSIKKSMIDLKSRGFNPKTVIDIGAYAGEWTRLCKKYFPESKVLMIEPLKEKTKILESMISKDISFKSALLGSRCREQVYFHKCETASMILPDGVNNDDKYELFKMSTLDKITQDTCFQNPDLIKIDVQGYELEVFKGGISILEKCEVVLMEVNLLPVINEAPLFTETITFLDEHNFNLYDICSFIPRPLDGALWQIDAIFVSKNSFLLSSNKWK